jgi:hypothetical protein
LSFAGAAFVFFAPISELARDNSSGPKLIFEQTLNLAPYNGDKLSYAAEFPTFDLFIHSARRDQLGGMKK